MSLVELRPDLSFEEHCRFAERMLLNEEDAKAVARFGMNTVHWKADDFLHLVRAVHRAHFSGVPYLRVGEFRDTQVHVDVLPQDRFTGVEPERIEDELRSLWHRLNRFQPPETRDEFAGWGAVFLQRFFAIHPFSDGNGRTARVLLTAAALDVGLFFRVWFTKSKERRNYLYALRRAHASRGLTTRDVPVERDGLAPLRHWLWRLLEKMDQEEADPPDRGDNVERVDIGDGR